MNTGEDTPEYPWSPWDGLGLKKDEDLKTVADNAAAAMVCRIEGHEWGLRRCGRCGVVQLNTLSQDEVDQLFHWIYDNKKQPTGEQVNELFQKHIEMKRKNKKNSVVIKHEA